MIYSSDMTFFNMLLDKISNSNYCIDYIMIVNGSKSMKKFGQFMNIFKIPFLSLIGKNAHPQ